MNNISTPFTQTDLDESETATTAIAVAFSDMVLDFVAAQRGVTIVEIRSPRRAVHLVEARAMCVWLLKHYRPGFSYPVIGRWLGDMHHASIIHLFRMGARLRQDDRDFLSDCELFAAKYRRTGEIPYACE